MYQVPENLISRSGLTSEILQTLIPQIEQLIDCIMNDARIDPSALVTKRDAIIQSIDAGSRGAASELLDSCLRHLHENNVDYGEIIREFEEELMSCSDIDEDVDAAPFLFIDC